MAALDRFAADVQPVVLPNRLALQPVVIVTADGVDADALDEARTALDLAGARVVTTITVAAGDDGRGATRTPRPSPSCSGLPTDATPEDLVAAAADALAARLAAGPGRPATVRRTTSWGGC